MPGIIYTHIFVKRKRNYVFSIYFRHWGFGVTGERWAFYDDIVWHIKITVPMSSFFNPFFHVLLFDFYRILLKRSAYFSRFKFLKKRVCWLSSVVSALLIRDSKLFFLPKL